MAKKSLKKGVFITFEGVEGCGKSTHAKLIYNHLKRAGYPSIYTKEPGGTKNGEGLRRILLDAKNGGLNKNAELFLFEASRSQLVEEVIRPALRRGYIVICDRFSDATTAYQGYGAGMDRGFIKKLNEIAAGGLRPDLTVILDIDARTGLRRAMRKGRPDRMERRSLLFHSRVRKGYISIANEEPARVKVIVVKEDIGSTQEAVKKKVLDVISRYKTAG